MPRAIIISGRVICAMACFQSSGCQQMAPEWTTREKKKLSRKIFCFVSIVFFQAGRLNCIHRNSCRTLVQNRENGARLRTDHFLYCCTISVEPYVESCTESSNKVAAVAVLEVTPVCVNKGISNRAHFAKRRNIIYMTEN